MGVRAKPPVAAVNKIALLSYDKAGGARLINGLAFALKKTKQKTTTKYSKK